MKGLFVTRGRYARDLAMERSKAAERVQAARTIFVTARDADAAHLAAGCAGLHMGEAIWVYRAEHLQGYSDGVLLIGHGASQAIIDEAHRRGMRVLRIPT